MSRPARTLTTPAHAPPARWRTVSLEALRRTAPRSAPLIALLDSLVEECLRTGASRLHLEACSTGLRVRLRRDGVLTTRRGDEALAATDLDAALDALLDAPRPPTPDPVGSRATGPVHLVLEGASRRVFASLTRTRGVHASGVVVALSDHSPVAATLDGVIDDPRASSALRATLGERDGLVLLIDTDPAADGALLDGIAQELVAPDRKVVHVGTVARHPLPGVLQLDSPGIDVRDVLAQDADAWVVEAAPTAVGSDASLRAACAHALVVRALRARDVGSALASLGAEGADGAWLAHRLRAVVRVQRVGLLCEGCRRGSTDGSGEADGGDRSAAGPIAVARGTGARAGRASPALGLLSASLGRLCEAPGCADCGGTGIERTRTMLDVLATTPAIRASLAANDLAGAAAALGASGRTQARVQADLHRGLVGLDEAMRFGGD